MSAGEDPDEAAVRRASGRTALQVAGVSAAVVLGVLLLAALFVLDQSRPSELLERPRPGESKIYVGVTEVLIALVVLGVLAVAVVGVASRVISRRAVAPLGTALAVQRAFVADASHELRTPLAVLDTRLQVLQRRLERGEPHDDVLTAARRDVRRMSDLVTDLLLVAERGGEQGATDQSAHLRTVVGEAVDAIAVLAEPTGVAVDVGAVADVRVALGEAGLRRALIVLLDNAVAHAPAGTAVSIEAELAGGLAVVRVADRGGGMQGVDVARAFERFAHGAETGRRRGFGLGLSLVRDLAVRHGGRVAVESTSAAGTVMRLELPVV